MQRNEFSSTLSPFCPLPEQMRPSNRLTVNAPPAGSSVPVNDTHNRKGLSSPTFSGSASTGRETSPTTPDSVMEHDGRPHCVSRSSPLTNSSDHLPPGQSHFSSQTLFAKASAGSVEAIPNSPLYLKSSVPMPLKDSTPFLTHSATSDHERSPHSHVYLHQPVKTNCWSRPSRPW